MTTRAMPIHWFWIPFIALAILTGLYPLVYFLLDMRTNGLLAGKSLAVLHFPFYVPMFYTHISFGGIALLTGWSQFRPKWRQRNMKFHRTLGKIYMLAVLFSSLAGLFISFFSSGGIIPVLGFGTLALLWLYTDFQGYLSIRRLDITIHRQWMIRNYALAFAAVTLRIYLPLSSVVFHIPFEPAYRTIAWICWIPNLLFAEISIKRLTPYAQQ
jgi:uncharacterized membrane protein